MGVYCLFTLYGLSLAQHDGAADLEQLRDGVLELARLDGALAVARPRGVLELRVHDDTAQRLSRRRLACEVRRSGKPGVLLGVDELLESQPVEIGELECATRKRSSRDSRLDFILRGG